MDHKSIGMVSDYGDLSRIALEADLDVDELRARLARMSDRALLEFGRARGLHVHAIREPGTASAKAIRHAARRGLGRVATPARAGISRGVDCAGPLKSHKTISRRPRSGSDPRSDGRSEDEAFVAAQTPKSRGRSRSDHDPASRHSACRRCRQNKRRERHNKHSRRRQGRDLVRKQLARPLSAFMSRVKLQVKCEVKVGCVPLFTSSLRPKATGSGSHLPAIR
jgi:hypothetical protein